MQTRDDQDFLNVDARGARWLRRHFAGGVAAVTTVAGGQFRAATVSACMVASLEPLYLLVSLDAESQMAESITSSGLFAVSVLPWREQFLADQFAGFTPRASPSFYGIEHTIAASGAPILSGCIAWADCSLLQTFQTGDHLCFLGDVVQMGQGKGREDDPLIFYLSRYRRFG